MRAYIGGFHMPSTLSGGRWQACKEAVGSAGLGRLSGDGGGEGELKIQLAPDRGAVGFTKSMLP